MLRLDFTKFFLYFLFTHKCHFAFLLIDFATALFQQIFYFLNTWYGQKSEKAVQRSIFTNIHQKDCFIATGFLSSVFLGFHEWLCATFD